MPRSRRWAAARCEPHSDDKGFPRQRQGQISGRRRAQTRGKVVASCQNCEQVELKNAGWGVGEAECSERSRKTEPLRGERIEEEGKSGGDTMETRASSSPRMR